MKKLLLILAAALTLSTVVAEAYIVPGRPPGHGPRPRPRPPVRPDPGPAPYPDPYPGNPYPGNPGYGTISVPVYVDRYMFANGRLDISQYIDLYQYRGYRLVALDFTASAQYNTALIDVLINGFQVAPTINLNGYPNNFRIFPNQEYYIGYGADSIVLYGRGNLYISNVYLQLSR